jgi:hypothetical protein
VYISGVPPIADLKRTAPAYVDSEQFRSAQGLAGRSVAG